MATEDRIHMLVLEEFQLFSADADGAVARIVDRTRGGREPALPLLTSIDDRRHVATIRGLHGGESSDPDAAQRSALDPFVSSWQAPKHYAPRIAERSQSPPTHYRLAVTESGINDADPEAPDELPLGLRQNATSTDVGLLWIGQPVGTHAGLLVLLGGHDGPDTAVPDSCDWPLPLSRKLGVRIYVSGD